MKTLNRFLIRLRNLVTGRRGDQRLREELEDYVAREAEANIQAGMSEEEARRQARMKLGAAEAIREQYHAEEGLPLLECLAQDTRFSLRQMRRSLGFTLVVVLTMALGIAATTTMFTVVYSTLLRSLPYPQSERIVAIHDTRIAGRSAGGLMTGPRFYDIEARNRSFSSLAFFYFDESTLIAGKKLPIYVKGSGSECRILGCLRHSADARAGIQCERRRAPCPADRGVELSRMAAAFRRRSERNRRTGDAGSADGDDCGRDAARFFCAGRRGPLARGAVCSE